LSGRESPRLAGASRDRETRTRTGDTTIFRECRPCAGPCRRSGSSRPFASVPADSGVPAVLIGAGLVAGRRPAGHSDRATETGANCWSYLRACPAHSSNSRPTTPNAPCGSGTESSGSPSDHGPPRPDRGGRRTPTACASASTSEDRVPGIPPPSILHRRGPVHSARPCPRAWRLRHPPRRSVGRMPGLRGQPVRPGRRGRTHPVAQGTSAVRANKDRSGQASWRRRMRG
jgi:hypothetical protein